MAQTAHVPAAARAIQAAGLLSWLAVGAPCVVGAAQGQVAAAGPAAGWAVFGAAFAYGRVRQSSLGRPATVFLVGVQTAATLPVAWAQTGLEVILLVMIATQLPAVLGGRGSILWVVAQTVLCVAPMAGRVSLAMFVLAVIARLGFQAFGLGMMYLAALEASARQELARANEELRSAHALQAENARLAERLRIARELHDSMGHHLAALSLSLEAAAHLAEGKAAAHVATARDLGRRLLAEVREVVSGTRGEASLDFPGALRALAQAVPAPHIHLDLPDGLEGAVLEPERAQAALRCVQEIVTNAIRHAAAEHLWIRVRLGTEGLLIEARDDGRGVAHVRPGNGLNGMRERLEQAGGRLEIASTPGTGFAVTAVLPTEAA